jgi:hypothetical protein
MREHYERWWTGIEPRLDQLVASHLGSDAEETTLLCCSEWQDVRCDGQPSVRNAAGGPRGGPWNVIVERAGSYSIELRRWPADADAPLRAGLPEFRAAKGTLDPGKALPIAAAHLSLAGQVFDRATEVNDKAAIFNVNLPRGRTQLHGWFRDKAGQDICGAYFAYVTRAGKRP